MDSLVSGDSNKRIITSQHKCGTEEPIRPENKKRSSCHYSQSKQAHAERLKQNIHNKHRTKDGLLKQNTVSTLEEAEPSESNESFLKQLLHLLRLILRLLLFQGPLMTPSCPLLFFFFFHCWKKLFIILPITHRCLSSAIKPKRLLQSAPAFISGVWLCQLE